MSKFKLINLLITSCLLSAAVNAQTVKAVVGQANQVQIKLENQKSDQCSIEVTFPNGNKGEFVTSKPEYVVNIEFNPTTEGANTFLWQGKLRMRGLRSTSACEGSGKLTVNAVPSNETKIQRWREVASKISDKQKTCINAGLKIAGEVFDVSALTGEIKNDVNEPISKEIRNRCERFADVVLAKNTACKINEKQTFCDEYFEITINGLTKQLTENDLNDFLFRKEQIQKVIFENTESKSKREIAEAEAKSKRELADAEEAKKLEAYKKTPAYKKEQAELVKKQAIEEAKAKKEQADLEKQNQVAMNREMRQVMECALSHSATSAKFKEMGDAAQSNLYMSTGLNWMNYGQQKIGESEFNKLLSSNKINYTNYKNDKLDQMNSSCKQLKPEMSAKPAAPERTFCAMSSLGTVGCGLTAAACQKVVQGLPGMFCR
jgi:hypothetical protein